MSKWVSVEDGLPDKPGPYNVVCNDIITEWQDVAYAYICPEYGNVIWEDANGEDFVPIITEWELKE